MLITGTAAADTLDAHNNLVIGLVTFFTGTGAPSAGTGNDGDFYFRRDGVPGAALYQKESGNWQPLA